MVSNDVIAKKPKKNKIQKIAKLSQPWNLTFFEDATFQLFFSIICLRSTRMKIAHIEWGKKPRTLGKVQKMRDLEGVGLFHPFKNTRYMDNTFVLMYLYVYLLYIK